MIGGEMLFYGGIGTGSVALLLLVVCIVVFPKQRRKKLRKLGSGEG